MAIAFDATTDGGGNTSGSLTFSHTCSALSGRYLIVGCWDDGARTPTVTYNGVSASLILSFSTNFKVFGLAAPATGANNVVVSWGGGGAWQSAYAASYTGVSQTGQPEATGTKQTGNPVTTISASVTTVTDNAWAIGVGTSGNTVTAGTDTTLRRSAVVGNGVVFGSLCDSNAAVTPAGARTLIENMSSGEMNFQVMSFAPLASGPANLKSLNGNLKANIKSIDGNVIANVKSLDGNA